MLHKHVIYAIHYAAQLLLDVLALFRQIAQHVATHVSSKLMRVSLLVQMEPLNNPKVMTDFACPVMKHVVNAQGHHPPTVPNVNMHG